MVSPITDEIRLRVRTFAESNMIESVTIVRGAKGPGTLDPDTGRITGMVDPTEIYEGKARLPKASAGATVSVAEGEVATRQIIVSVPWSADQVRRDDLVTIEAPCTDPQLVGTVWRVLGVDGGGAFGDSRHLTASSWYPSKYWDGEAS